ncbi:MAG: tetratricopeptide repeat protein [Pseudomonadota bacterium]
MQVLQRIQPAVAGAALLALVSCGVEGALGPNSFQSQYDTARSALESGRYARAITGYERLAATPGPFQARVQLELAHSYLRAGEYAKAAQTARALTAVLDGEGRAAALAVQGTADHELGLAALAEGDRARGASFLRQADAAMKEVVDTHPELDPLGALAARRASIKVRLG